MGSTVWQAKQDRIHRPVAVKLLPADNDIPARRFEREARIASNLHHANIVVIYDYGPTEDGKLYLVMELLEGLTLEQILRTTSRLPPERALHIAAQVLRALSHAHSKRVVHRDLKPSNLFLTEENEDPDFIKVLDFGLAKYFADDESDPGGPTQLDVTGQRQVVCGTPSYMAPEQWRGGIDARTDIYALGVILYRMLTGKLPVTGHPDYELYHKLITQPIPPLIQSCPDGDFSDGLERLVMTALARDPEQRYASAREMRADIQVLLGRYASGEMAPVPVIELGSSELERAAMDADAMGEEAVVLIGIQDAPPGSSQQQPVVAPPPSESIVLPGNRRIGWVFGGLLAAILVLAGMFLFPRLFGAGMVDGDKEDDATEERTEERSRSASSAPSTPVASRETGKVERLAARPPAAVRPAPRKPTARAVPAGDTRATPPPAAKSKEPVETVGGAPPLAGGAPTSHEAAGPDPAPKKPPESAFSKPAPAPLPVKGEALAVEAKAPIPGPADVQQATVRITSNVKGVRVRWGKETLGRTPLDVTLDLGTHELRLDKRGYRSQKLELTLADEHIDAGVARRVTMQRRAPRAEGRPRVTSAPAASARKPTGKSAKVELLGVGCSTIGSPAKPTRPRKPSGKAKIGLLGEGGSPRPAAKPPKKKPSGRVNIRPLDE